MQRCSYCPFTCPRLSKLAEHERMHTGERPFVCGCGKQYARKQHLMRHEMKCGTDKATVQSDAVKNTEEARRLYTCSQCTTASFKKKKTLWAHMAMVHRERRHICSTCQRSFPTMSKLTYHTKKHHDYTCSLCPTPCSTDGTTTVSSSHDCPTTFKNFAALRLHRATVHPRDPLECPTCGRRFTRPSRLAEHEATHTPGGVELRRKFVCQLCSAATDSSTDASSPFTLPMVAFTVKRNLLSHMRSAHSNLVFACSWPGCPVILSTKQKLTQHLERHKHGRPVAVSNRARRCTSGTRSLSEASSSRKHKSETEEAWETASNSSVLNLLNEMEEGNNLTLHQLSSSSQ